MHPTLRMRVIETFTSLDNVLIVNSTLIKSVIAFRFQDVDGVGP